MKIRRKIYFVMVVTFIAFLFIGCKKGKPPAGRPDATNGVKDINYAVLEYPDIKKISLQDKILAYYLTTAAACGDPIFYQQLHPEALRVKGFLDGIFSHSMGIKPHLIKAMGEYGEQFYANHGFRNRYTGEKIIPSVDIHQFNEAVLVAASNGARVGYVSHREIWETFLELESVIYDSREKAGKWKLTEGDTIRAGNDTLSGGLFYRQLSGVVDNLRKAREYSDPDFRNNLEQLAVYLETGSSENYNQYLNSWFENSQDVDISIGFTKHGGFYYGLVYINSEAHQDQADKLINITGEIIDAWDRDETIPKFKVIYANLLSAYGFYGYTPPEAVANFYDNGVKIVIFPNVLKTMYKHKASIQKELCISDEDYSAVTTFLGEYETIKAIAEKQVESLVCGSKIAKEGCSPTNAVFREALVLHILIDDRLSSAGIYPENNFLKTVTEIWIRESLAQISASCSGCSKKAKNFLLDYFIAGDAISSVKIGGKTYLKLEDGEAFRKLLSSLLSELHQGNENLTEKYAVSGLNEKIIEEISGRLKVAGLYEPEYIIAPKINLKTTRMGKVKDVIISIPADIIDSAMDTAMKNKK